MRECVLTLALFLAATGVRAAEGGSALLRIPLIGGLYTVEAPGDWHLEERGSDLTAAFSAEKDSPAALVIAAPNPAISDAAGHSRLVAAALIAPFGSGKITHEQEEIRDETRAHALWFDCETASRIPFRGWVRTTVHPDAGASVRTAAVAPAENFDAFMRSIRPILDSYELDAAMAKENTDLLREVGEKIIESF